MNIFPKGKIMENEKLFEFMTRIYSEMKDGFKSIDLRFDRSESDIQGLKSDVQGLNSDVQGLKSEMKEVKKTLFHIEQDHGKQLEVIFDGLTQHTDQLTRIENQVNKQDEIILRRIK